jgi:hypothetical protein
MRPSLPGPCATAGSGPSVNQTVNVQLECSTLASISVFWSGARQGHVRFRLAATHGP